MSGPGRHRFRPAARVRSLSTASAAFFTCRCGLFPPLHEFSAAAPPSSTHLRQIRTGRVHASARDRLGWARTGGATMGATRREFLRLAGATGVGALLPWRRASASAQSPSLRKFIHRLPGLGPSGLPVATAVPYLGADYYQLTAG